LQVIIIKKETIILVDELPKVFQEFDKEFNQLLYPNIDCLVNNQPEQEKKIKEFLNKPCVCGKNCQEKFSVDEVLYARKEFKSLSWNEKNCFILAQLRSFRHISQDAKSGRIIKKRQRQRFDYRITADRPVCRTMFLFYHGETIKRIRYLQKHLVEVGTSLPAHGNIGRKPKHAYSDTDKFCVESFITNYAAMHGLPDPGRDLRTKQKKIKILLPSIMSYKSVHRIYLKSMHGRTEKTVEYNTFLGIWHKTTPHICFIKPRSDLCLTCENHKKAINMATNLCEEERIIIHEKAMSHLEDAKKERDHYRYCLKMAEKAYLSLSMKKRITPCLPNSAKILMHYSWDFAQQVYYPYEDQQVGPIYFKVPRKAQLFGVCCEGIPRQVNYLIDEADFLDKGSNTVISLLDHFFAVHGLGETHAYLSADNCVGQNKNNSLLHYLLFRTMIGLHNQIDLSFMIVGHTKFAPDGYFGRIKYRYRRAKIYTYHQMSDLINSSSPNGQNICQTFRDDSGKKNFEYRQWSAWLSTYFKNLPNITKYQHFSLDNKNTGVVVVKKSVDGEKLSVNLLKNPEFRFTHNKLPDKINPKGLSVSRAWYLYDKIREHIPLEQDKDATCPLPKVRKTT